MLDQSIQLMFQAMLKPPVACARIEGSSEIHNLTGDVYVYPFLDGSLLAADVQGIPFSGFYGFHIHQHGPCIAGEGYTGFHDVGGHYTTVENAPHPYHAGDLPSLMAFYGHAFMIVYTDRFRPEDILGRAMIIHEWPDDFRTQPGGDSGQPIGCGTFYPCTGYIPAQPARPGAQPAPVPLPEFGIKPVAPPGTGTQPAPPSAQPTPPSTQPAPPSIQPTPPSAQPTPPSTQPALPSVQPTPPGFPSVTPPAAQPEAEILPAPQPGT